MKTFFLPLFLMICLTSCKKEKTKIPLVSKPTEIVFKTEIMEDAEPKNCDSEHGCATIAIQTLTVTEKSVRADSINKNIFKAIRNCAYFGEKPEEVNNYKELTASFLSSFKSNKKDMKTDFPNDSVISWETSATAKEVYKSAKTINISVDYYGFTGGAHGYGGINSLIIDVQTGKLIPSDKIFNNLKKVKELVEAKFRQNQELSKTISLTEVGYFFDKDVFVLPNTILYSKNGLIFHYNQYEAASYAQGPIEFEIPYSEIEKYLVIK